MSCPKCTYCASRFELNGRPFAYWCDLEAVLQIHGIDGPLELSERLLIPYYQASLPDPPVLEKPPCDFCHDGDYHFQVFRNSGQVMHHIEADFCPKCGRKLS